jgi:hypothetical protein
MATGAFGSPIQMVHSTEPRPQTQVSIGTRIVRAATQEDCLREIQIRRVMVGLITRATVFHFT